MANLVHRIIGLVAFLDLSKDLALKGGFCYAHNGPLNWSLSMRSLHDSSQMTART
jgi:hypothetical protein